MILKNVVKKNSYYDSATLMLLTSKIGAIIGSTKNVAVMMATDMNKELMESSGLLDESGKTAGANDLVFAIKGQTESEIEESLQKADEILNSKSTELKEENKQVVKTTDQAIDSFPNSTLAVVSLPGEYAFREVKKLLLADKHVMLFSDNVSIEEENELKDIAVDRELLMMGPDCGTAIINGIGLGFANKVNDGKIGLVAASGTGLQEVARLISNSSEGISHAFGTGGRDVKEEIGGKMMLSGLSLLEEDPNTEVVVVVSKPPADSVVEKVLTVVDKMTKPVVLCFLGADDQNFDTVNSYVAHTLEEAAHLAVQLSQGRDVEPLVHDISLIDEFSKSYKKLLNKDQQYIRGLYCGGTLAYESMLMIRKEKGKVFSNISLSKEEELEDTAQSKQHTVLDLGDDAFTVGKPHPMIEPSLRGERLIQEALDPEVAVVLLDVEIGYGSHEDPASVLAEEIAQARKKLIAENREVVFVATICGTYEDYQGYEKQKQILEEENVIIAESNAEATLIALSIVSN